MKINLSIINFTGVEAASYRVRYARVDNINNPTYFTAGSPTSAQFPFSVSNVDNGQYEVGITPVYSDGRVCAEVVKQTPPCQGIIALNAVQDSSGNIKVTYTAPGNIPQVYLTVNYPNGGSFTGVYTNGSNGNTILVPIPSGVNGEYTIYMQSVCDPDTGFYSEQTPPVSVSIGSQTVVVQSSVGGVTITEINGISGFNLSSSVSAGERNTGTHDYFAGAISVKWTGTPAADGSCVLSVNGSAVNCQNLPNTSGGTVLIPSGTYYSTDIISISFNIGAC